MKRSLLAALLPLLLVACGASSPPKSSAHTPEPASATPTKPAARTPVVIDACGLLTKGDAETLAGTPLNPGQAGIPSSPSCTYSGPVNGPTAQVQIFVGDGAKKTLDIERTIGHTLNPVSGIGDEAYEENDNIFFRKSTTWVAIELVRLDDPAKYRMPLETLAGKVAGELAALGL